MSARRLARLVPLLAALAAGCDCGLGPRVIVVVELQTDLAPGIEFTSVRTTVGDQEAVFPVGDTSFARPARVAELRAAPGVVDVRVQVLDDLGRLRGERLLVAQVRRDTGVVAFISAACRGVICRGAGETCVRGTCQDARAVCGGAPCTPGRTDDCAPGECDPPTSFCPRGICDYDCASAEDCPATDPCSTPTCEASVCLGIPRADACPRGFFCAVGVGCIDIPAGIDAGVRDGSVPASDGGLIEYCRTCTTPCGTTGLGVCERGVFTGECHPPDEYCNGQDDDCDGRTDEGLGCEHQHDIVCEVHWIDPITLEPEMALADRWTGGGPGLVCGGAICSATITNCRTLPGGMDGHVHPVSLGGAGSLTITDDVPFSVAASVGAAVGHTHGARCGLGTDDIEVEGGLAFHRIRPMGDDVMPMPQGRFDHFCIPPVGDPDTECFPAFGFCETR
ncbi:MAG: hypothetical protein KF729_15590 [Sandaracinaceae bacterium]|nr:hypothetical protein [Sandaracinaceae bacterium]